MVGDWVDDRVGERNDVSVSLVNSFGVGGAAIAARRLHRGLRLAGVDASFKCLSDGDHGDSGLTAADTEIVPVRAEKTIAWLTSRILGRLRDRWWKSRSDASRFALVDGICEYSDCRPKVGSLVDYDKLDGDLINLHWVSQFIDYPNFFHRYGGIKPIVWTLHDMRPMTGGCHYAGTCDGFLKHCGNCPQLLHSSPTDVSAKMFSIQENVFSRLRDQDLKIVTPSRWLKQQVEQSRLLGRFEVHAIANSVDENLFRPLDRAACREILGFKPNETVVLFVANGIDNKRKGFDLLVDAIDALPPDIGNVTLVSVGKGTVIRNQTKHPMVSLGPITNDRMMPVVYNAADIFVIPSRGDNLPNTVLESMACGTPVLGFPVGGIVDMVRPAVTGWLADEVTPASLAKTLGRAMEDLSSDDRREAFRAQCRAVVCAEYATAVQTANYIEIYDRAIKAFGGD